VSGVTYSNIEMMCEYVHELDGMLPIENLVSFHYSFVIIIGKMSGTCECITQSVDQQLKIATVSANVVFQNKLSYPRAHF
jgi:hypothetical protein